VRRQPIPRGGDLPAAPARNIAPPTSHCWTSVEMRGLPRTARLSVQFTDAFQRKRFGASIVDGRQTMEPLNSSWKNFLL